MDIRNADNVVNVQGVAPDGVLTDVLLGRGLIGLVRESHHLTLLRELVVTIGILQGKHPILTWCHTLDDKASVTIGTSYTQQRLGAEGRVCQVVIESYLNALDRFQIGGLNDVSRHFKGIDLLTCRERIGVVAQRIPLVVVRDGIAEVDSIGDVGLQRVFQLDNDFLASSLDFRHLYLWWRHDDVLGNILHLDVFVEIDGDFPVLDVRRLVGRRTTNDAGRVLIIPATVRTAHSGTAVDQK